MVSASMRASMAPPPNSNLYCAQCDSQIGIFENEWVRLTASYMRSKERGTHFGTEVGTRTQTVPAGSLHNAAEGCEMSEIFCKKCSAGVGQFCKTAPDREKQKLVNQYFYKLSRIYLKDSNTSARVEPMFAFGGPDFAHVATGSTRSSLPPRTRLTSIARSSRTPLRQSFPPDLGNTSSYRAPDQEVDTSSSEFPRPESAAGSGDVTLDIIEQDNAIAECSSRLAHVDVRSKNQGHRLRDHEERLGELDFRMINSDTRFQKLESLNAAYTVRCEATENLIATQTKKISDQNQQLVQMSCRLESLQHNMQELKKMLDTRQENSVHYSFSTQSEAQDIQALREENASMRAKLNTMTTALGGISESDIPTLIEELSHTAAFQSLQTLGKRKRDDLPNPPASEDVRDTASTQADRLVRNLRKGTQQIPTPGSSQASETSPTQAVHTKSARVDGGELSPMGEGSLTSVMSANDAEGNVSIAETDTDEGIALDIRMEDAHDNVDESHNNTKQSATTSQGAMLATYPPTIDFSDDETGHIHPSDDRDQNQTSEPSHNAPSTRNSNRRVTDTMLIDRDSRSMAPEPAKRLKVGGSRRHTLGVNLERNMISTPDMFKGIDMGRQPKNIRPKVIQAREVELNEELTRLGLTEWIGKSKNSKAYREALDVARSRERELKKATQLFNRGLSQSVPSTILTAIQNLNGLAAANSATPQDLKNMYDEPYLQGVLRIQAPKEKPKRVQKSTAKNSPKQNIDVTATVTDGTEIQQVDVSQNETNNVGSEAEGLDQQPANTSGMEVMAPSETLIPSTKSKGRRKSRKSNEQIRDAPGETFTASTENNDDCAVCGKRGKLLCCDGCPKVYHHKCLDPPLNPKDDVSGDWYCPTCKNKRETRPLQAIDANIRAQREKAIMERDRLAREAMEREETMESRRY